MEGQCEMLHVHQKHCWLLFCKRRTAGKKASITSTSQKLHALARISTYMEKPQLELTITTFIMSHFSYCPLVWTFHDRASNNKINKIHERALIVIHKDSTSNFQELLIKSNSVSVHQRNLQLLLTENYKTVHNFKPNFHDTSI